MLLTAIGLAAFIVGLDNTILNIALPAVQRDFELTLTGLQWVGTSYILAFSSLLLVGGRGGLSMKAAVYGTVAGILFGLSAALTKPTLEFLHDGIDELLTHWEPYALAIAGVLGFVLQQVSLGTGRLAPSVATVSVANPVVGILLGIALFDERLSRPAWHVVLALIGLGLALVGAVVISIARETGDAREQPTQRLADPATA